MSVYYCQQGALPWFIHQLDARTFTPTVIPMSDHGQQNDLDTSSGNREHLSHDLDISSENRQQLAHKVIPMSHKG